MAKKNKEFLALKKIEDKFNPIYRIEILDAFNALEKSVIQSKLIAAIETGSTDQKTLEKIFKKSKIPSLFDDVEKTFQQSFNESNIVNAKYFPTVKGGEFFFDTKNPAIKKIFKDHVAEKITYIDKGVKQSIKDSIEDAYKYGRPPRKVAKDIAQNIGMNGQQNRAYLNLRAKLEADGVSKKNIEKRLLSYKNKAIKERAKTIAVTELSESTNYAQREYWRQADENGFIPADAKKTWLSIIDDRTSKICRNGDGGLNGKTVPYKSEFTDIHGNKHWGPPAHIKCRSGLKLEF